MYYCTLTVSETSDIKLIFTRQTDRQRGQFLSAPSVKIAVFLRPVVSYKLTDVSEVLSAAVIWLEPCILVQTDRRFRAVYCARL
jgi:hypothetical protein